MPPKSPAIIFGRLWAFLWAAPHVPSSFLPGLTQSPTTSSLAVPQTHRCSQLRALPLAVSLPGILFPKMTVLSLSKCHPPITVSFHLFPLYFFSVNHLLTHHIVYFSLLFIVLPLDYTLSSARAEICLLCSSAFPAPGVSGT